MRQESRTRQAIRALLEQEPNITQSAVAREVGISKSRVSQHFASISRSQEARGIGRPAVTEEDPMVPIDSCALKQAVKASDLSYDQIERRIKALSGVPVRKSALFRMASGKQKRTRKSIMIGILSVLHNRSGELHNMALATDRYARSIEASAFKVAR